MTCPHCHQPTVHCVSDDGEGLSWAAVRWFWCEKCGKTSIEAGENQVRASTPEDSRALGNVGRCKVGSLICSLTGTVMSGKWANSRGSR